MPKWLWWFLEPFTIPQYKLTALDGFRATLFVIICIIIIFAITLLIIITKDKIERWNRIRRSKKK